jgi:tetratricopeptide (TPR) repeat protein
VPFLARVAAILRRNRAEAGLVAALAALALVVSGFAGFYLATRGDAAIARRVDARERVEAALSDGYARLGAGPAFALSAAEAFSNARSILAADGLALEDAERAALSDESLAALALASFEGGRPSDALAAIDRDPSLAARSPAARVLRENALRALGRIDEAAAIGVVREPPRTTFELFLRGLIHAGRASASSEGDVSHARAAFDDLSDAIAAAPRPRSGLHLVRVRAAGLTRDKETLARAEAPLLSTWPGRWSTWFVVGLAREDMGAGAEAAEAFEHALATDPPKDARPQILARLADARRRSGRIDLALAASDEAVRLSPKAALPLLSRALARHSAGDVAAAAADYEAALKVDPSLQIARRHLAMLAHRRGDAATALRLVAEATKADPTDGRARYLEGVVRFESGDLDGAIAAFTEATRLSPKDAASGLALARTLSEAKRAEEAEAAAKAALALDPSDVEIARLVASLAVDAGRPEEAVDALRPFAASKDATGETLGLFGKACLDARRFDEAAAALRRALDGGLPEELSAEATTWLAEAERGRAALESPASRKAP